MIFEQQYNCYCYKVVMDVIVSCCKYKDIWKYYLFDYYYYLVVWDVRGLCTISAEEKREICSSHTHPLSV